MSYLAITRSTCRVGSVTRPAASTTSTGSAAMPSARSSSWSRAHIGGRAPSGALAVQARWLALSTVGSHTNRAPARAASSTARGFMPPTEPFSVIAPTTPTPGTARRTMAARSAVGK